MTEREYATYEDAIQVLEDQAAALSRVVSAFPKGSDLRAAAKLRIEYIKDDIQTLRSRKNPSPEPGHG
jgi:exonuclease VII small subunit